MSPLDLPARRPMVLRHLETFQCKARERLSSRQSVWLQVLRGTIGTDVAIVVVVLGENCKLCVVLRCRASCRVRMPSMLRSLVV